MALQNIGASNRDDAFYRYKMPKMITKIEGRGNGIKTNVVNMVEIAKALARPPAYTTKYFGCELGAQSKFDQKTGISLVNGAHDTAKLALLLENFIKKYVQCYGCGNPETEILITKTQMITLKCAACGFISDVDMRDKLTTFIIKNPPEQKKGSKDKKAMRRAEKERLKEGETADEEMKRLKKEAAKKKGSSASSKDMPSKGTSKKTSVSDEDRSPLGSQADEDESAGAGEDDGDDVQWQTDTSAEAARQRIQEQLSAVTAGMVMLSTAEEKPKSEKKSPERNGKPEQIENESSSNYSKLIGEIREFLKKGSSEDQLKSFLPTLSGTPQEMVTALFEVLFEDVQKGGFSNAVAQKSGFLGVVSEGEGSQMILLRAIESFCLKKGSKGLKEVALILKALYDGDVLEEDFILEWYKEGLNGTNKSSSIWKNTEPFVRWLQDAESETETE